MLFKIIVGLIIFALIMRIGWWVLKGFAIPVDAPPPEGELRKVNLRYRCSICGAELRMTLATDELPEPPRHCQEDMELTARPDDD